MSMLAAAIFFFFAGVGVVVVVLNLVFWKSDKRMEDRVNASLDNIFRLHQEAKAFNAEAEKYMRRVQAYYEADCEADQAEAAHEAAEAKLLN